MDAIDRIFELVDQKYKDQKDFADALGVIPAQVSKWRNRKSSSYRKYLPEIAVLLDTSTEYLLTGEGPKRKEAPSGSGEGTITEEDIKAAFFNGADPTLTPEERDAMWEDAQEYFRFKIAQRRRKQRDGE